MLDAKQSLMRQATGGNMKNILICDHEPIVRMNLKTMLSELGINDVLECGDGKSAVELALGSYPDLAIMDASMPGMDGVTAAFEIRKKLKIPIVLMTDSYDHGTVKRASEVGVASFLIKPIRMQDLQTAIETAFLHTNEIEELKERIEDLKETIENRKIIEKAKGMLMDNDHLREDEAYRKIQKLAMDNRKSLRQIAEVILKKRVNLTTPAST